MQLIKKAVNMAEYNQPQVIPNADISYNTDPNNISADKSNGCIPARRVAVVILHVMKLKQLASRNEVRVLLQKASLHAVRWHKVGQ